MNYTKKEEIFSLLVPFDVTGLYIPYFIILTGCPETDNNRKHAL
jgi:hypothetical protein